MRTFFTFDSADAMSWHWPQPTVAPDEAPGEAGHREPAVAPRTVFVALRRGADPRKRRDLRRRAAAYRGRIEWQ